jgi:ABC-type uncharacterized transport system substrate-binding protein
MTVRVAALCLTCLATPVLAHPHIFVDTTHQLIFDDQGRLSAVRVTWDYDELFSFTMLLDEDYDTDGDGHVTGDELEGFRLWDAGWVEGYKGDIELFVDGRELVLEPPTDWDADWHDGRAVSIHTRVLVEPVDISSGLILRAFEPEFFTAYTITDPPSYHGRTDCAGVVVRPDPDAVPEELSEQLAALDMDASNELVGVIDLAHYYADEVHVTCGR